MRNGHHSPVVADDGIDAQPAFNLRSAAKLSRKAALCRLIEEEPIRTAAAHVGAKLLKQIEHEVRDASLLKPLLCVACDRVSAHRAHRR